MFYVLSYLYYCRMIEQTALCDALRFTVRVEAVSAGDTNYNQKPSGFFFRVPCHAVL